VRPAARRQSIVGSDRRCQPVAAPRQRNTDDEKKAIKQGRTPANWKAKPAQLRHKDRDARWTVKFSKAKPR
jgi:transposase, IS5 family